MWFANGSGDGLGDAQDAQQNQLLRNDDGAGFTEQAGVFDEPDNAYAIKAGDLDGDGDADLVVGVNFSGQSYALLNEGDGAFTRQDIPASAGKSIGDLELGDVDGDGDLDVVATDWGASQPHGQQPDPGQPLHLWLGNGDGTFEDGDLNLPMGMETWASWSFDLELVDLDNDYALDVLVSSRGPGFGFGLENDGAGAFTHLTIPALTANVAKQVNAAFTPADLDGDGFLDLITLQDGVGQGGNCIDVMGVPTCARRNSILINDGTGNYVTDNPGNFWAAADNPAKLDFDAATLDFDNDGRPDFVTTGLRLGVNEKNSRLFLNKNGTAAEPAPVPLDAAFPIVPELAATFGLQFADFDHDRREDVAVVTRDAALPNFVLFGRDDPTDGVAIDTTPPRIYDDGFAAKLGTLLFFGQRVAITARVDDAKTPVRWHDFQLDANLGDLNLIGDGAPLIAHNRRLPYMEFALGLDDPSDLPALADGDPKKFIAPSIWFGEALWRVGFTVPYKGKKQDTLTWQYCAVDAADNKICVGPFSVMLLVDPIDCGDGVVQAWETCDDDSPTCVACEQTCGNGIVDEHETPQNCPEDSGFCDGDGACEPPEDAQDCPGDCDYAAFCGDGFCQDPPETEDNCFADCGHCDHDGACDPPENTSNCPDDCPYDGFCGDGIRQVPFENPENCPQDGADPTGGEVCGNGVCDAGETVANCAYDCVVCGDDICTDPPEDAEACPEDCPAPSPDGASAGGGGAMDDDSACNCSTRPQPASAAWMLLGLVALARRRRAPT
jgi:MYXO-CTERM domain-containing protein